MGIPYTATATSLTLVVNFRPTVIPSSHPNFAQLKRLAASPDTTERDIVPLLDIPTAINNYTGGDVTVVNGRLFYRGSEVKNNLATLILGFVKSGDETAAAPFKAFLANCRRNPDLALVDTIYDWCVKSNMPITPDGELIAWKIVGRDYKSITSGKRGRLDHSIGAVVTEPREECDPNRNQTCSTGINFCSIEYLEKGKYGGGLTGNNRIVAVVINPEDITAIPTDYNLSKGRCCKLRVVGEVENKLSTKDYYGGAKVYGGWSAPSAPVRKTRTWTGDLRIGDVVRCRDGSERTVSRGGGSGSWTYVNVGRDAVYPDVGRSLRDEDVKCDRDFDVIDVISRAPQTYRNAAGFATGQVWARRNGSEVTLLNVGRSTTGYPVSDGTNVYTKTGRFNSDSSVSQFDLVRLVKDVA